MADTGWQFPGTADSRNTTQAGVNKYGFTNPENAKADDGTLTGSVGPKFPGSDPGDGPELVAYNFGFSVPTGATITGVETKIQGYTDGNRVSEIAYLTNETIGGGYGSPDSPSLVLGTLKRNDWTDMPTTSVGYGSPDSPGTHIYGSSTDVWSASLTPEIVNDTEFGWIYMIYDDVAPLQMQIDFVQMRVHYELAATPPIIMMIGA